MKPLDLQVGIQNSYEAARSEGVRLEKPHVAGMLANEDAQREQVVRDQSVTPPESKNLQEDLFSGEEYHAPDYADAGSSSRGKGGAKKKHAADAEVKPEEEKKIEPEHSETGGFSTYA
jgi:hypothetical protein